MTIYSVLQLSEQCEFNKLVFIKIIIPIDFSYIFKATKFGNAIFAVENVSK